MRGMGLEMFAETQTEFNNRLFSLYVKDRLPAHAGVGPQPRRRGGWGVSSVNYNSTLWVRLAQERILMLH